MLRLEAARCERSPRRTEGSESDQLVTIHADFDGFVESGWSYNTWAFCRSSVINSMSSVERASRCLGV
jgi:hypothetical protein